MKYSSETFEMVFIATCVYLRGNLRVLLATQRKSPRKFNLRLLATTCESVSPFGLGLKELRHGSYILKNTRFVHRLLDTGASFQLRRENLDPVQQQG